MPTITTVAGPIDSGDLGATLAHEHLYCDLSVQSGRGDNRFLEASAVIEDLRKLRLSGGSSVVEMTTPGIGRSTKELLRISRESGVNVISGIGLYAPETHPYWVRTADVTELGDFFCRWIEEGSEGIRAGLIGELYSHNDSEHRYRDYALTDGETRVFAAAAEAQRRTGVAIATHASIGRAGIAQLEVLERSGAELSKVAIGHCDAEWSENDELDLEYYVGILDRGAFCSFDMIGWGEMMPDEVRADRVAALVRMGYAGQVLLSSDTCRLSQLTAHGGRGYDFTLTHFLPMLRARGVGQDEINAMLVEAPQRLLSVT